MRKCRLFGFVLFFYFFIIVLPSAVLADDSSVALTDNNISNKCIFILEPSLVYENAYTEQRFGAVDESTWTIVSSIVPAKAKEVLLASGFKSETLSSLDESKKTLVIDAYRTLYNNAEELIKQWKDKSVFSKEFNTIRDVCKSDFVLVLFIKAKLGAQGYWDVVNTGNILPATDTTTFKAVLINLNSGKIEWSDASVERDKPHKYVIEKCLKSLFKNFPGYPKERG